MAAKNEKGFYINPEGYRRLSRVGTGISVQENRFFFFLIKKSDLFVLDTTFRFLVQFRKGQI
jgi:hypothetical protein